MAKKKNETFSPDTLKLIIVILLCLMIPLTYLALRSSETTNTESKAAPALTTGNGAPSGAHYNLNVHGKAKTWSYNGTNDGHSLFIPLVGKTQISLIEGSTFSVLDPNATDGKGSFQLPNPDPDMDGVTSYSVWVRPLAKPGGKLTTVPCANVVITDPLTGITTTEYSCSTMNVVTVREAGKSKFADVSKQLLYLWLDLDGDGVAERYNLFDTQFEGTFWDMTNDGSKLVQMRFYSVPSDTN